MAYVKQTWSNGDIVNADKLNHIEDGIYDNSLDNTYSTSETFTGKYWVDGKPIYRKVIEAGTASSEEGNEDQDFILIPSNVDTLTYIYAYAISTSLRQRTLPVMADAPFDYWCDVNQNILYMHIHRNNVVHYADNKVYCVVEYTKTTD